MSKWEDLSGLIREELKIRKAFEGAKKRAGIDLKTVQELLGHKSFEMTLRYAHLSPDHKKAALDVLGKRLMKKWKEAP